MTAVRRLSDNTHLAEYAVVSDLEVIEARALGRSCMLLSQPAHWPRTEWLLSTPTHVMLSLQHQILHRFGKLEDL